jgi:hypothetical protein
MLTIITPAINPGDKRIKQQENPAMSNKNDYAHIAGIFSIISGAMGILMGLIFAGVGIVFLVVFSAGMGNAFGADPIMKDFFPWIIAGIYGLIGFGLMAMGILSIIGGNFALKRKRWAWALAGAISGAAVFFFTGIAAVILVSLGKAEFGPEPEVIAPEPLQEIAPPPASIIP